jgi:hypothetical protein
MVIFSQKNCNVLVPSAIDAGAFHRLRVEVGQLFKTDLQWSAEGLAALQVICDSLPSKYGSLPSNDSPRCRPRRRRTSSHSTRRRSSSRSADPASRLRRRTCSWRGASAATGLESAELAHAVPVLLHICVVNRIDRTRLNPVFVTTRVQLAWWGCARSIG